MNKILCLLLALTIAPLGFSDASARAGGGFSGGSRGGRTYSSPSYSPSYSAAPITRSTTAPSAPARSYAPSAGAAPGMAPAYSGGGGFMRGIAGGFLGAGLAHMLFGGGGGYGGMGGMGGYGGGGGGFLPLLLIAGIVYLFIRRRRNANFVVPPDQDYASMGTPSAAPVNAEQPLSISPGDQSAFGDILLDVQRCWSAGDLNALRQYVTPEMVQYFSEQLSANASRGMVNKVEQVTLDHAEILESWSEYGLDYATARLSWHAFDTMVPLGQTSTGTDVTQSRSEPAQEIWTFVRSAGGHWLLSAIQQTQ